MKKKLNKYISAGVGYRLGMVNGENFHRLSGNIEGKYKINKFTFSLRETYQSQKQTFVGDDEGTAENYLRSRLGVKYTVTKKIRPECFDRAFYAQKQWCFSRPIFGETVQESATNT